MSSEGVIDNSNSSFILVFGVAGSGKTTLIRNFLGDPPDNGPPPVTTTIQGHEKHGVSVQGKRLILVDTPETNILKDILVDVEEWMGSNVISFDYIHGIVFLHPIDLNRADVWKTQQILDKLLGTGEGLIYRRVALVTSLWPTDEIPEALKAEYTDREASLQGQLWSPFSKKGAMFQRYDGTPEASRTIIESLLSAPQPDQAERARTVRAVDEDGRLNPLPIKKLPKLRTPRWMSFRSLFKSHAGKRVIVLLGPSGSGKSSFVENATGHKVEIGGTALSACTTRLGIYEKSLPSGSVIIIDTPGYDIGDRGPTRVLELLKKWFDAQNRWNDILGRKKVNPSAFLFFHRISDTRASSIAHAYSSSFKTVFEESDMPSDRIHVATTMWDKVIGGVHIYNDREVNLKGSLWGEFLRDESYHRLECGGDSALRLFGALVEHDFDERVPLPIILENTGGGIV